MKSRFSLLDAFYWFVFYSGDAVSVIGERLKTAASFTKRLFLEWPEGGGS